MMKIISFNVNHSHSLSGLLHHISVSNPDLCFLQEVVQNTQELCTLVQRFQYTGFSSLGPQDKPGVGVLYKSALPVQEILPLDPGQLLLVKLETKINFLNIYAPSGNSKRNARRDFFGGTILRNLSLRSNLPILIGDFNCILSPMDCTDNFRAKNCPALKDLTDLLNYSDGFRVLHPEVIDFTFYRPHLTPSRLDRVYLPGHLKDLAISVDHFSLLSDHKALSIELNIAAGVNSPRTQPSYWKLNTSVLQDEDFLPNFNKLWNKLLLRSTEFNSISAWWEELVKPSFKNFLIQFSIIRAKARKGTKSMLFTMLDLALEEQDWEEIAYIKSRIRNLISEETQGFLVRSRTKEHAERERGSLFHVNREVNRGQVNNLTSLKINNIETVNKFEIQEEVLGFYSALLNGHHRSVPGNSEPVDTGRMFEPDPDLYPLFLDNLTQIQENDKQAIEAPLSLEELKAALDTCASSKSPGLDGLPYEFYKKTYSLIGPTLVQVFQNQLDSNLLIKSYRTGVTRLISKVNSVPTVSQLRPITLLACDYKILTKILASRLNAVLPSILSSNQLCTNKPRNILFGGLELLSSIDYINMKNLSGYIVSFDIFKAYDKTTIGFISKVMRSMGFGNVFISWIETLHKNITTCFILGSLSESIDLFISLRQGDPLAMPLFLLNMEPLLVYINKEIKGLQMAGFAQKDTDYVDDVSAASSDLEDLVRLDKAFTLFEKVSGTVLNRTHKSKIMGLGGWEGREHWPLPWLRTETSLKIFGITFLPTVSKTIKASWETCITGFRNCIQSWSSRHLPTLSQRVMVLNTFAMSKLWYLAQILPIPKRIVEAMEKEIRAFLWLGRLEKLSLDELCAPVKSGGLGLPLIKAKAESLLLKQTCRILATNNSTRKHVSFWLGNSLRNCLPELRGPWNTEEVTEYFKQIASLVKETFELGIINPDNLGTIKTKIIYNDLISTPPPPKIVFKRTLDWDLVWNRLESPALSPEGRDLMFTIIHDIYPAKDRLFKLNQHPTGFCSSCRGVTENTLHLFTDCSRSRPTWVYMKILLNTILPINMMENFQLLMFGHTRSNKENTYIFLISNYVLYCHEQFKNEENLSIITLKSYLKDAILKHTNMFLPPLGRINI